MHPTRRSGSTRRDLGGVVLGALAIVLGSVALGLLANHFSPHPVPVLQKTEGAHLALPPGITGLTLAEAKRDLDAKQIPFLDARSPEEYAAGHLPGALSLPVADFENHFLALAERLEAQPTLIVYCESADCGDGLQLAERLKEAYQGKVMLFEAGWLGWVAAKYPVTKGEQP